jgi:hypothetical protein
MDSRYHDLELSYEDYLKMGSSLAKCQIDHYYVYKLIDSGNFGDVYYGID